MNLRLILLWISFVFSFQLMAQSLDLTTETGLMSKTLSTKVEAEGSPYINDTFQNVKISGFPNQIYSARYNAYSGEMEIKLAEDKLIALDVNGNYDVTFINSNTIYRAYTYTNDQGNRKSRFLVVVEENENFILLKEETIKFYDKVKANSSYQNEKPAKFRRESDVYYINLNGSITHLPDNKKNLQKNFPSLSTDLKTFLKEEKISLNKEEDLTKLCAFIASKQN